MRKANERVEEAIRKVEKRDKEVEALIIAVRKGTERLEKQTKEVDALVKES